ncbi:ESX secretion-associated protein EspG [Nocardia sp. CDC159]|uniref:ESX secretion-associated protein EspG n=1 Tax=Nocardia pulmonis TaxID=2951408 RepID=A0A9X2EBB9_9NOCA|nr:MULTISPECIES: ESX secretion-associated protein EspG [Nocardia]MCM6776088.1 ESX secretion-associated protein EspG [Nocardia pulmonis]MCM6788585.1 ESX secretion-associated protein EspG [Nocardia sp. CDC159]
MSRSWKFSGFDFYVLWQDATGDRLPWPFFYTNRMDTIDEFEKMRLEARERLRRELDPYFGEVLAAFAQPDIWIAVNGWDGRKPREPKGLVRIRAARRGDRGWLIIQETGGTYWDASGFTVTEGGAVALADDLVAALPAAGPGKGNDLILPERGGTDELDFSVGRSAVHDSFDETVTDRAQRFLDTVPVCTGSIDIEQGRSIFGPRGLTRHRLTWRDLEGDGRYVIDDQHPPVARPSDDKRMISLINGRIAEIIRAIKDERR